ncbi:hypothetical protein ACSTLK_23680, partial [Vibrio parahaemolyticus]
EVVVTGNKGSKSRSLSGNADAITVRAMGSEIPKNEEYYDKVFTEVRFLDPVTGDSIINGRRIKKKIALS